MPNGVRIDKWLWSVRLFKTRSQATEACKSGKVLIDEIAVKPSREVQAGDKIHLTSGPVHRTVEVKEILKSRVGAKLVENYMIDRTPQEEYDRHKLVQELNYENRDRGIGRPTKRERRLIEKLKRSKF